MIPKKAGGSEARAERPNLAALALSEQRFDQVQGQLDCVRVRQDDGVATVLNPDFPFDLDRGWRSAAILLDKSAR
jgi:hypothetical protein